MSHWELNIIFDVAGLIDTIFLMKIVINSESEYVMHMANNWNRLVNGLNEQKSAANEIAMGTRSILEEVDDKVMKAVASIGKSPINAPAITLWGSIGAHEDTIQATFKAVETTTDLANKIQDSVVKNDDKINSTLTDTLFPILVGLTSKMEEFEKSGAQGGAPDTFRAVIQNLNMQVQALVEEVQILKSGGGIANPIQMTDTDDDVTMLRLELGRLRDDMVSLKAENKRIRSELNTENISFGGFSFQDSSSYLEFVVTTVPGSHWGFCYDFISIFELHVDGSQTSDDSLKSNHLIGKVGYKDLPSARIDNSFRTMIPKIFGIEQDPKNPSKKMGTLVSMDIWDHPTSQSGVKEDIRVFLDTNASAVILQIESLFGTHSSATLFFSGLIGSVVAFWNHLESWITRFEKDLMAQQSSGDDEKTQKDSVWKLICWMLHAMFKEMLKRRQPGSAIPVFSAGSQRSDEELQRKCASILHGTLAAHKFMKELMSDNFVRHPIFAATMDEYLLKTKASQSAMIEVQTKMAQIENRLKGTQAAVDRLSNEKKK